MFVMFCAAACPWMSEAACTDAEDDPIRRGTSIAPKPSSRSMRPLAGSPATPAAADHSWATTRLLNTARGKMARWARDWLENPPVEIWSAEPPNDIHCQLSPRLQVPDAWVGVNAPASISTDHVVAVRRTVQCVNAPSMPNGVRMGVSVCAPVALSHTVRYQPIAPPVPE